MTTTPRLTLALVIAGSLASPNLVFGQAVARTSGSGTSTGTAVARNSGGSPESNTNNGVRERTSEGRPGVRGGDDRPSPARADEPQRRAPAGGARTGTATPRSGGGRPSGGRQPGTVGQTRGAPGPSTGNAVGRSRNGAPVTGNAVARSFGYPSHPIYPNYPYYGYGYYPSYGYPYYPYYGYPYYPYYGYPYYGWGYPYGLAFSIGFGYGYGCCGYPYYGGYGGGYYSGGGEAYDEDREPAREIGSIRLKAKPAAARVYIDGALVGSVDEFDGLSDHLSLDPGRHTIEIRADGYETYTGEVVVEAGKTLTERISLKKKS